jgi:hypothetical protein
MKIDETKTKRKLTAGSTTKKKSKKEIVAPSLLHSSESRQALIAEAAYLRAERRGFAAGHELEDWLAGEAEVDQRLIEVGRVI